MRKGLPRKPDHLGGKGKMHRESKKRKYRERLTYANVMSTFAVFLALGGATALAAGQLGTNSVGSRQLKAKSVTTGKIASNAVNGTKVASRSLTGEDINLSALGTVPEATHATSAGDSAKLGGRPSGCPANTTLIDGLCFDSAPNPVVPTVEQAADECNARGGFLPTPLELYETRGVLNLGVGGGDEHQYTDSYYGNTNGGSYSTITVDGNGIIAEQGVTVPSRYTCAYQFIR
jgi:hypothetical protein